MVHHHIQRTIKWCTIIYSAGPASPRVRGGTFSSTQTGSTCSSSTRRSRCGYAALPRGGAGAAVGVESEVTDGDTMV